MSDDRKRAWLTLLYYATLDLRAHVPGSPWCRVRWWSPFYWRSVLRKHHYNMELANLMHNLAECAIRDLRDWDEATFWRYHDAFQKRFGTRSVYDYRAIFDHALTEAEARGA